MATQYAFGKIVTDGLIVALNAADVNSYVSGSISWRDLSGNNNTGVLTNGPIYDSGNGGSILFDGTNDYINLINTITTISFTIQIWIKTTQTGSFPGGAAYAGNGIVWSDVSGNANDFIMALNGSKCSWLTGNPESTIRSTTDINTNKWFMVTALKDGLNSTKELYINTGSEASGTSNANVLNANSVIRLGGNTFDNRYFLGNMSAFLLYNRTLSASEILQNYNAQKSRFGL